MDKHPDNRHAIAIVVTPYFNALATCAFLDPFRVANYLSNDTLYHWNWYSSMGGAIQASNSLEVNTLALADMEESAPYMGVVSSSWTPEAFYGDRQLNLSIHTWAKNGALLCGIDTGAFILARMGMLRDRAATVHYEHIDTFQEVYPEVQCGEQLYVMDGQLLSTGGGVASVDLALQLIRKQYGKDLANASARYIFHDR